ncbi:MAG: efflux RND transporter periplasmic adaptor subunit, partial [Chloroflexi bacterium]|nr:efflux RND transporter periplasmic adaptor subunit [Chloroflexota bacterium]
MLNLFNRLWDFLKKNRKITIPVGVVLLLAVIFVVTSSRGKSQTTYQTYKVVRGELTATVGATGTVRSSQSATLIWQAAGTVENVNVKVGDQVKKNDELASLSKTSLPQSIILAEADLVSAQKSLDDLKNSDTARAQAAVALTKAQDAYDKAQTYRESLNNKIDIQKVTFEYFNGKQIPVVKYSKGYADAETIAKADNDLALKKAQLDDAQRTYDRVKDGPNQADLAAAQARVDAAQATINMARIVAPFNGTVTQSSPIPGDQVAAGKVAFRVDDLADLLVDVQVSEVDINSIAAGQPVTLTFDAIAGQSQYRGEVIEVSQAGDVVSGAVNFTVTVRLNNADAQVKPGMTAAVNIVVNQVKGQLLVPNRAVRLADGKRVVYVLVNGKPQQVEVKLGSSSDTMSVVLDGSLKEGDLIILNPPAQFMGPGGGGGDPLGGGG